MTTMADLLAAQSAAKAPTTMADLMAAKQAHVAQADQAYKNWSDTAVLPPRADGGPAPAQPAPPKPEGFDQRNPEYALPADTAGPSALDQAGHRLHVASQGAARGVLADIPGMPVDLTTLGLNAGLAAADTAAHVTGMGDVPFRFQNPVGGSNYIADKGTELARTLFGHDAVLDPSQMTPADKSTYAINRMGGQAAVSSAAVRELPALAETLFGRKMTAPYKAVGSDTRVLAGDTAAGAGSGASMSAYDNYAPEKVKKKLGPVGEIIAGLVGGGAGAASLAGGEALVNSLKDSVAKRTSVPEGVLSRDPTTQLPYSKQDLGKASVMFQGAALRPQQAAHEITSYLGSADNSPHPTSALISGDPGMLSLERRLRTGDAAPDFIAADHAVMNHASDTVKATRPAGANPEAPRPVAQAIIDSQQSAARQKVADAAKAVSANDAAKEQTASAMAAGPSKDQASRALDQTIVDKTYVPARAQKNALYDAAAADPNVVVKTDSARAAARDVLAQNQETNPTLRDSKSVSIAKGFTHPNEGPTGQTLPSTEGPQPPVTRTLAQVLQDRRALSSTEQGARAQGNFGLADTARGIRKGINQDVRTAAESGVPGTEPLAAADKNYQQNFAPYFRDGNVSPKFFKSIDQGGSNADGTLNRSTTPPEATASKFLTAGPNSRAAASDVSKIISISPDPAEGMAAARDYLIADAVGKGVIQNGKVSENRLASWMANREGALSQLPEVKAHFDKLLTDVRRNNAHGDQLRADMEAAAKHADLTDRQINEGALKLVMNREPRKAVEGVFAAPDSVKAMREVVASLKHDPKAADGWKAAVSDWLSNKVTTASKAAVDSGSDTVSLHKLANVFDHNEKAMAEVFSPKEMSDLRQVKKRLEVLSNRGTQASAGSSTAENAGGLQGLLSAFGEQAGFAITALKGSLRGNSVQARIKMLARQFPDGNATAHAIIKRAMFDPKLAHLLLTMPTSDVQMYTWSKKLNKLLNLQAAAHGGANPRESQ